jgi:phosphatidylserine/phosphatidylglycerophosphate/cardiolipin synthase-like enzyme
MLVQKLNVAQRTIDAALHELDSKVIADALVDAEKRGVKVRVVTETDYMDEDSIEQIQGEGIQVVNDMGRGGLMHNKFIVIDGRYSWTGSFNTTDNDAYKNNNNAILIDSFAIAKNFETEFEEMFTQKKFGSSSPKDISNPIVRMPDGTEIKTLFSPENDVDDAIIAELNKARQSIFFMAFSFTHQDIGQAMIDKYRAGVDVRGIFETRGSDASYSQYPPMKAIGISVKQDTNKWILHHKVIIIDGETVITGSFNFSKNAAQTNEENILIISGNRAIVQAYLDEFARVYGESISVTKLFF